MLYDKTNPLSIESYGKKMIGRTFEDIANHPVNYQVVVKTDYIKEDGIPSTEEYATSHAKKTYKGGMGLLVEECYFGYEANSNPSADFEEAGVELKVTPYKKTKKGFAAKERLVLTMINYFDVVKEQDFEHSHLWEKAKLMLLVWYMHQTNTLKSTIDFVQLFSPPQEDLSIIIDDYNKIVAKIKCGKAHELSEGDTLYLGACTKASTSKDRRQQPFSDIEAKPRAFSLKNSYMTYVLNNYIIPGKITYESILKDSSSNFETYVVNKIAEYAGKSVSELCNIFSIENPKAKNLQSILAFKILGVSGNHATEFEKAGIAVKAIRIAKNGKIKESMSFPAIKYDELALETWETSTFGNYLRDTRFFFVIYEEDQNEILHLKQGMFWNIPYEDLEGNVHKVWQETHDIVAEGHITLSLDGKGKLSNNFPKASKNPVSHVRPHAQTKDDTSNLPPGTKINLLQEGIWPYSDKYTKHCFWLNNSYILEQIKKNSSAHCV